jgi:hypothetical protein
MSRKFTVLYNKCLETRMPKMDKFNFFKKALKYFLFILTFSLVVYTEYRLFNIALKNIIQEIRHVVSKEISDSINPLKWPKKIFGHKHKDKPEKPIT